MCWGSLLLRGILAYLGGGALAFLGCLVKHKVDIGDIVQCLVC